MGWQSMMLMGVCIQSPATMSKNFLNLAGWFFLLHGSPISSSTLCIPVRLISVWKDLKKWTKVNAIIVVDTLIGNNKLIEVLLCRDATAKWEIWEKLLGGLMTEWLDDQMTGWPMTGWQEASQTIDRMVYLHIVHVELLRILRCFIFTVSLVQMAIATDKMFRILYPLVYLIFLCSYFLKYIHWMNEVKGNPCWEFRFHK